MTRSLKKKLKKSKALNKKLMVRFACYLLVLMCAFCRPSISEEFQLPQDTDVKFKYFVAGLPFEGEFKVIESKFDVNFRNAALSAFSVKFDLIRSNAGFPIATKAMKQGLGADIFPSVLFKSASVEFKDEKFYVVGFLQIRNVSKPVNLVVTAMENYSATSEKIRFSIRTSFSRRQFGANGYYPLVHDAIIIDDILTLNKFQK